MNNSLQIQQNVNPPVNSSLVRNLKISGNVLLLGGLFGTAVWPTSPLSFLLFVFAAMTLWVLAFYLDRAFLAEDIPFLFLIMGTLIFSRAFSIIGITILGETLFVTEIVLGFSVILYMLQPKRSFMIWRSRLNPDLFIAFVVYLLFGTVHLGIGVISNGPFALRDIVFCHYALLFFIVLRVMSGSEKIIEFSRFVKLSITAVLFVGCLMYLIPQASHLSFYQFIKETKQFNWGFIFGLVAIGDLCFFTFKKKRRWISGAVIHMSLFFVVLTLVRSAWLGLIAAFVFLAFVLKKEVALLAVAVPLLMGSVFLYDLLPYRANFSVKIWEEVEGSLPGAERSVPRTNLEWRLSVWQQTLHQISKKPVLGWGFGHFPSYVLWGQQAPLPVGTGPNSGILPPHNHLMAVVYKTGFLGLILFLYINGRIFILGFRHLKQCRSAFLHRMLAACLAGLIYWHTMAFFFDMLESPPTGIYLWILLGMVVVLVNADREQGERLNPYGL